MANVWNEFCDLYMANVIGPISPDVIYLRPDVFDEIVKEMPPQWHFKRPGEDRTHFVFNAAVAIRDEEAVDRMRAETFPSKENS